MKSIILLSTGLVIGGIGYGQCVVDEANVFEFEFEGKTYELIKENKNWPDAAECANNRGGVLARIDSEEENTALFNAISTFDVVPDETTAPDGGGGAYIWLGGTDRADEGVWIWDGDDDDIGDQFWEGAVDGSPVDGLYNNWGDEPDDFGSLQDGAAMSVNGWPLGVAGEWNDVNDDDNELYFFVEYEPDGSGIEENKTNEIYLYPNPVSNLVFIAIENSNIVALVQVLDVSGKVIQTYTKTDWVDGMDVSGLESGTYFVEIRLEDGERALEKFVK